MAFGVTEPDAGTDTSRIQTRAKHGDRWIVNGEKSGPPTPSTPTRSSCSRAPPPAIQARPLKGMTLFFADFDRATISVRLIHKLGRAAVDSNEIFIDDLEIPDADVVGTPGEGFYHLLDSLNPERIVIGIEAVGIGRAALDRAVQYAKERDRLRPADRAEPGHRASARPRDGPARRGRDDVSQGRVALR